MQNKKPPIIILIILFTIILISICSVCVLSFMTLSNSDSINNINNLEFSPTNDLKPETSEDVKEVINTEKAIDMYDVIQISDGDTIWVKKNGEGKIKLRLIGIDTPELAQENKPVECFAKEATIKATQLLEGQKVRLEVDTSQEDIDKYSRYLRYVFLEDGTNFNELMISEGYAYEYTYNKPYKYQSEFKKAQKFAQKNSIGLWGKDTCNGAK